MDSTDIDKWRMMRYDVYINQQQEACMAQHLMVVIDDGEDIDIRESHIVTLITLDEVQRERLDDDIVHDDLGSYAELPAVSVDVLYGIAKAAAEYRKAEARGQLLQWLQDSGSALDSMLVMAGFVTQGELDLEEDAPDE